MPFTFDWRHYVPVLRVKRGEVHALRSIPTSKKDLITPLLEIPPDMTPGGLAKLADELAKGWGTAHPFFLDFNFLSPKLKGPKGQHPIDFIFAEARAKNLQPIPIAGPDRSVADNARIVAVASQYGLEICVRVLMDEIPAGSNAGSEVTKLLSQISRKASDCHLILDFKENFDVPYAEYVIHGIQNLKDWRSFTITSSGFPRAAGGVKTFNHDFLPRRDWTFWRGYDSSTKQRRATFSDYGTLQWEPVEYILGMRIPEKIVYTLTDDWYIEKGGVIRKGHHTMSDICKRIMKLKGFRLKFSDGEIWIEKCAAGTVSPGNPETWIKIATIQHLEFVATEISNLP